jgi:hypothetical protein
MVEIHANENFDASIDDVFALVSDHERFLRGFGVDRCVVTTPGTPAPNGLGAIREVVSGPIRFLEEIVRFEPPHRYDYRIVRLTVSGVAMPMEHELGWLELQEAAGLVRLDWFSRFRITLPLAGALESRLALQFGRSFGKLLGQARKSLAV